MYYQEKNSENLLREIKQKPKNSVKAVLAFLMRLQSVKSFLENFKNQKYENSLGCFPFYKKLTFLSMTFLKIVLDSEHKVSGLHKILIGAN